MINFIKKLLGLEPKHKEQFPVILPTEWPFPAPKTVKMASEIIAEKPKKRRGRPPKAAALPKPAAKKAAKKMATKKVKKAKNG